MKKYKIQLNARAYRDLEEIFEYIANDLQSPEYAKGQTDRLWKSLKTLEIFPSSHQERLVGNYAGKGYRQLLIDNYLAIFKIDEQRKIVKIITIQYQGEISQLLNSLGRSRKFMGALRSQIFLPQRCCFLFPHAIKA